MCLDGESRLVQGPAGPPKSWFSPHALQHLTEKLPHLGHSLLCGAAGEAVHLQVEACQENCQARH